MNQMLDRAAAFSLWQASGFLLLQNVLTFFLALLCGEILIRCFRDRRVAHVPEPIERREITLAAVCVLVNTVVTIAGWLLWKAGYIVIRRDTGVVALLDMFVLLVFMDFAMYVTHRIAHIPILYRLVHSTHHRYDRPRPLNLFVLSPIEVLGFGGLWLLVMTLYHASWLGTALYLMLNLIFGLTGHLGVEPFPRAWAALPFWKHLGTSTFHARHHQVGESNYGFYTNIWDRLFGTLIPRYEHDFGQIPDTLPLPRKQENGP